MNRWRRVEALVVAVPRIIVGVAIFLSIALNLANIAGRYLFQAPIIWAEEVLVFLMVWSVFVGAVLVTWEGRHLKMDLVSAALPSPFKQILNAVALAVMLAVCGVMVVQSWTVTAMINELNNRSTAAGLPMVIPHLALLLGFVGMLLAALLRARAYVVNAFGTETEAATRQMTETFGVFEGAETERPAPPLKR